MKILSRIKIKGITHGYIIEIDGKKQYINNIDELNIKPTNAIKLANGEWRAKSGYKIDTLDEEKSELIINKRNTKIVGKPDLLYNYTFAKLSKTQKTVLAKLKEIGLHKLMFFDKNSYNIKISLLDISALTAYTGVEFTLFERADKYALAMGTSRGITLNNDDVTELSKGRYKWIGHTHPGNDFNCLIPSDGDYETLKRLNQKSSVIFNSVGMHYVFSKEGDEI